MDLYQKAFRKNICEICTDSNEKGFCSLNKNESCSLQLYSQKIVDIVHSIIDGTYQQYYDAISDQICKAECIQDDHGNCYLSSDGNCSINRYITLVIDTIHKVDKQISN